MGRTGPNCAKTVESSTARTWPAPTLTSSSPKWSECIQFFSRTTCWKVGEVRCCSFTGVSDSNRKSYSLTENSWVGLYGSWTVPTQPWFFSSILVCFRQKTARVLTFEDFQRALEQLAPKRFKGQSEENALRSIHSLVEGKGPTNIGVTVRTLLLFVEGLSNKIKQLLHCLWLTSTLLLNASTRCHNKALFISKQGSSWPGWVEGVTSSKWRPQIWQ